MSGRLFLGASVEERADMKSCTEEVLSPIYVVFELSRRKSFCVIKGELEMLPVPSFSVSDGSDFNETNPLLIGFRVARPFTITAYTIRSRAH